MGQGSPALDRGGALRSNGAAGLPRKHMFRELGRPVFRVWEKQIRCEILVQSKGLHTDQGNYGSHGIFSPWTRDLRS